MTFRAGTISRVAAAILFDAIYDAIVHVTWRFIGCAKVTYEGHKRFIFCMFDPILGFLMDMREFVLEGRVCY